MRAIAIIIVVPNHRPGHYDGDDTQTTGHSYIPYVLYNSENKTSDPRYHKDPTPDSVLEDHVSANAE
jgi:hypothetical protein